MSEPDAPGATPGAARRSTWSPPVIAGDRRLHRPGPAYALGARRGGTSRSDHGGRTGERNRLVSGLKLHACSVVVGRVPGAIAVGRALAGAAEREADGETDQTSLSLPARSSVSTNASTAHAAPIATAW
jgi:hypothetical protein